MKPNAPRTNANTFDVKFRALLTHEVFIIAVMGFEEREKIVFKQKVKISSFPHLFSRRRKNLEFS